MKSGNRDKTEGKINELKGNIEKKAGEATNNRDLRAKGAKDKAEGHGQQARGDVKKAFDK